MLTVCVTYVDSMHCITCWQYVLYMSTVCIVYVDSMCYICQQCVLYMSAVYAKYVSSMCCICQQYVLYTSAVYIIHFASMCGICYNILHTIRTNDPRPRGFGWSSGHRWSWSAFRAGTWLLLLLAPQGGLAASGPCVLLRVAIGRMGNSMAIYGYVVFCSINADGQPTPRACGLLVRIRKSKCGCGRAQRKFDHRDITCFRAGAGATPRRRLPRHPAVPRGLRPVAAHQAPLVSNIKA